MGPLPQKFIFSHIMLKSPLLSFHVFKSLRSNFRTGRLPRLQICPLRASEWGASLPVSESPGEPRLHEGCPKGAGAAVAGAEAQTCLRGASLQTCILKRQRERQKRSVCQCAEVFLFCFVFSFYLSWLTAAAAVSVCSGSPSVLHSVVVHFLIYSALDFIALGFFFLYFIPFSSAWIFVYGLFSLHLPFPFPPPHSYDPSLCLYIVCRALVSIKWTSLLLQKDSLKCQRDPGEVFFLSPYLSWGGGDNNSKNNRVDLNGSKGTINILLLNYVVLFLFCTRAPPRRAQKRLLCAEYLCAVFEVLLPVNKLVLKKKKTSTGGGCIPASEGVMTMCSKSDTFADAVNLLCGALTSTG